MPNPRAPRSPRFVRSAFRGRCRRNLFTGLVLLLLAVSYAIWGGQRFSTRGADARAFDQVLVRYGAGLVDVPIHMVGFVPENDRELYLTTVISDQKDVMDGLTILLLRMILAMSGGGIGLVLLTAGATEWEVRSETTASPGFRGGQAGAWRSQGATAPHPSPLPPSPVACRLPPPPVACRVPRVACRLSPSA